MIMGAPRSSGRSAAPGAPSPRSPIDAATRHRYRAALRAALRSGVPFLVGGAFAFAHYTGIDRWTKDLDLFIRPRDVRPFLRALAEAGLGTELKYPHWLAKAYLDGECIDVIFSSGNGIARVDDGWFDYSVSSTLLEVPLRLCPPEEMIWSKGFIMERERYDGADIAHLIRACHARMDWARLLARFGSNWRVLLSHITLFAYVYPGERDAVPAWVVRTLTRRLLTESREPAPDSRLCRGPVLSRAQYLADTHEWGYVDARVRPHGAMTTEDIARWTAAIHDEERRDADCSGR